MNSIIFMMQLKIKHKVEMINIWSNYLNDNGLLILEDIRSTEKARNIINKFDGPINHCSMIDRVDYIISLDDICSIL